MNFSDAVKSGFKNFANFSGRAARSEYWYFHLFFLVVFITITKIVISFTSPTSGLILIPIVGIICMPVFVPLLAVSVRRLHDVNRSGSWILIHLIPYIGPFIYFFFAVQKGTVGSNRFGLDPLGLVKPLIDPT